VPLRGKSRASARLYNGETRWLPAARVAGTEAAQKGRSGAAPLQQRKSWKPNMNKAGACNEKQWGAVEVVLGWEGACVVCLPKSDVH
jgi:hypothetical protein